MNELRRHKKSDKIKWVLTGIAFLLVAVMLTGICLQLFGTGKQQPSNWFKKPDTEQTTPDENAPAIDENGEAMNSGEVHAMAKAMTFRTAKSLAATPETQAASDYASVTLQATVLPEYAEDKAVDWSVEFTGARDWSTGKNVADYLTVTPSADGSTTATVQCLQPFGDEILVKVVSRQNPMVQNACTVGFAARVSNVNIKLTNIDFSFSLPDNVLDINSNGNLVRFGWVNSYNGADGSISWRSNLTFDKSDYTVGGNWVLSAFFEYSDEVMDIANDYSFDGNRTKFVSMFDNVSVDSSGVYLDLFGGENTFGKKFGGIGMVYNNFFEIINEDGFGFFQHQIASKVNENENFVFGTITVILKSDLSIPYEYSVPVVFDKNQVNAVRSVEIGENSVTI